MGIEAIIGSLVASIGDAGAAVGGALGLGADAGGAAGAGAVGADAATGAAATLPGAGTTDLSLGGLAGQTLNPSTIGSVGSLSGDTSLTALAPGANTVGAAPPVAGGIGGLGSAPAAAESVAGSGGGLSGDITGGSLQLTNGTMIPAADGLAPLDTTAGGVLSPAQSASALANPVTQLAPDNALGSLGNALGGSSALKSWGPLALAGAGMGYNLLKGNAALPQSAQLTALAKQDSAQGAQLQSYLTSGTLPPGVQSGLTAAAQSAEASIRSQYATRGQSGSSAEAQDIARMHQSVMANGASIASGLMQQGISESNMAQSIYAQLMQAQVQQDAALSQSIAGFSGALASSGLKNL